MTAKSVFSTTLCYSTFVSCCFFLACVNTSTDSSPNRVATAHVTDASSHYAVDSRNQRHLRTLTEALVAGDNSETDERMSTSIPRWMSWLWEKILSLFQVKKISPRVYLSLTHDKGAATAKLFENYGVNNVKSDLFTSSAFIKWSNVVLRAFKHDPKTGRMLVSEQLLRYYGGIELGLMCVKGEGNPGTELIIRIVRTHLLARWKTGDLFKSENALFRELGLQKGAIDLEDPKVALWLHHSASLRSSEALGLKKLLSKMKKMNVAEELESAKAKGFRAQSIAWGLQVLKWEQDSRSLNKLWVDLGLDRVGDITTAPNMRLWTAYAYVKGGIPISTAKYVERVNSRINAIDLARLLASQRFDDCVGRIMNEVVDIAFKERNQMADIKTHNWILNFLGRSDKA